MSGIALAQLGEIADLQAGVGFPVDLQGRSSGDYPVAKVGDISRVGRSGEAVISAADNYIDEGDLARLRARPIPPGSVLFAKIGEAIRRNHRVIAGCALLVDNNAMAAIPTRRIESRYLYHFLRTVDFYGLASATTVPALRKSELERLPVPLPLLPEQRRIAEILDKADALRAKRREALSQLDTLTQSIFLDMFGDPATNPKGWPVRTIRDLLESASYGTSEKAKATGEFPVLRMSNITRTGEMDFAELKYMDLKEDQRERYLVRTGDVLFNRTNSAKLVGKTAIYREANPMAYAGYLIRLRVNRKHEPDYLAAFLNTMYSKRVLRSMCKSIIGMANINATELQALRIPVPPHPVQHEFAGCISAVEKLKATHRISIAKQDDVFSAVQQRAFRGDL